MYKVFPKKRRKINSIDNKERLKVMLNKFVDSYRVNIEKEKDSETFFWVAQSEDIGEIKKYYNNHQLSIDMSCIVSFSSLLYMRANLITNAISKSAEPTNALFDQMELGVKCIRKYFLSLIEQITWLD